MSFTDGGAQIQIKKCMNSGALSRPKWHEHHALSSETHFIHTGLAKSQPRAVWYAEAAISWRRTMRVPRADLLGVEGDRFPGTGEQGEQHRHLWLDDALRAVTGGTAQTG